MNNLVQYQQIYNDLYKFRRYGLDNSLGSVLDIPNLYFFKTFFAFNTPNGLLGSSEVESNSSYTSYDEIGTNHETVKKRGYINNTAATFLWNNGEMTRLDQLNKFKSLLSDISTNYPWYIVSIDGIDGVLKRNETTDSIKTEDPTITITFLPDAVDSRIGTLFDLYNSICYSRQTMREILPVNLRRFDMGIFIFSRPIRGLHDTVNKNPVYLTSGTLPSVFDLKSSSYFVDCKYIELINCEIDPDSIYSSYSGINNTEGFDMSYKISIKVGKAFENRISATHGQVIGDFILTDMIQASTKYEIGDDMKASSQDQTVTTNERIDIFDYKNIYSSESTVLGTQTEIGNIDRSQPSTEIISDTNTKISQTDSWDTSGIYNGPLKTLTSNIKSKVKKITTLPKFSVPTSKTSIIERGTVHQKGKYDWLRYTNVTDSALGTAVSQVASLAVTSASKGIASALSGGKSTSLKSIVLGNINGYSAGGVIEYLNKIHNGNLAGTVKKIERDINN